MERRSLSPTRFQGQPWSSWTEFISRIKPLENAEDFAMKTKLTASAVMRLPKKEMDVFGLCPAREPFSVVVCEKCSSVVKPQGLRIHSELRHLETSVINPPPPPVVKKTTTKVIKPILKNTKSKVRLKTSVVFAKADSTTKTALLNNDLVVRANNLILGRGGVAETSIVDSSVSSTSPGSSTPIVCSSANTTVTEELLPSLPCTTGIIEEPPDSPVSSTCIPPPQPEVVNPTPICEPILLQPVIKQVVEEAQQPIIALSPLKPASPPAPVLSVPAAITTPQNIPPPVLTVAPVTASKPRRNDRKSICVKEKEYDADRHCGVVLGDAKPCTRSLTCRLHSVSLRKSVDGRSKLFEILLAEHRAAKDALVRQKKTVDSIPSPTMPSPVLQQPPQPTQQHHHHHHPPVNHQHQHQHHHHVQLQPVIINENVHSFRPSGIPGTMTLVSAGLPDTVGVAVKVPISLLSPITGVQQSEVMTVIPITQTPELSLPKQFMSQNSTFMSRISEPTEAAIPNPISTNVDITFSRATPRPLTSVRRCFTTTKLGGLEYANRKFKMTRQCLERLENIGNLY